MALAGLLICVIASKIDILLIRLAIRFVPHIRDVTTLDVRMVLLLLRFQHRKLGDIKGSLSALDTWSRARGVFDLMFEIVNKIIHL